MLKEKIEWSAIFFLAGLFIVVNGAAEAGVAAYLGEGLRFMYGWHPLLVILLIMWISGIAAAFVSNVSYTMAIITILGAFLSQAPLFRDQPELQRLMWWGLVTALCLGGNGTLMGAAANLAAAGIADRAGIPVGFRGYLRYGLPVTLGSMIVASLYLSGRYFFLCR